MYIVPTRHGTASTVVHRYDNFGAIRFPLQFSCLQTSQTSSVPPRDSLLPCTVPQVLACEQSHLLLRPTALPAETSASALLAWLPMAGQPLDTGK
jgi:hypothetical protein